MANLIIPAVASAGIGLLGRLFAPHTTNYVNTPAQRLDNLGAPNSEFGYLIRDLYGLNRVNGCSLIYAKSLKEVITTTTTTQSSGGKGGGGNTTVTNADTANYYLTAVFLIGGEISDEGLNRVWANGVQIYTAWDSGDVIQQFNDHTELRLGRADQSPLDLLTSLEGYVPAFRGCSLLAFNEYPIELYKGSGFPKIDVEAKFRFGQDPDLQDLIWHVAAKAGVAQEDVVFIGDCGSINVAGDVYENSGSSFKDFIEDICRINFLYYWESDDKLYFDRISNASLTRSIDLGALGARDYKTSTITPYERPEPDPLDMPSFVGVTFTNAGKDHDKGFQFYKDPAATHTKEDTFTTSIVGYDGDMGRVARRLLYQSKAYKHKLEKLYLMPCYGGLNVGDCISINEGNVNRLWRIEKKTVGTNYLIELFCAGANGSVTYDPGDPDTPIIVQPVYPDPDIDADIDYPQTTTTPIGTATLIPLDISLITDSDPDGTGYIAVVGDTNWRGGNIYVSRDSGASYQSIASVSSKSIVGIVATATASNATTIRVSDCTGQLSSVTQAQFDLNNGILFSLGNEIIMARDAALISTGVYDLSEFKRGCRGTDWAISGHGTNEQFVLLSGYLGKIKLAQSDIGLSLRLKAVGVNGSEPSVASYATISPAGISLECYSPVTATATKDQGGNIVIAWDRRDRHDGWSSPSSLMSEVSERYEIDVMDGLSVARTLTSTSRGISYSAADQVTDFGSVQTNLSVKIYQLSAIVGRGYPLEVTLTPTLSTVTPVITDFSPRSGRIGDAITIFGMGFTSAISASIGGIDFDSFTVVNDGTITGIIASGTITGKVTVTNSTGTGESLIDFVIVTSSVIWGDVGGDIEDQTDLIDLINSTPGGLTESDVLMLLPDINTQIRQAIAALPVSTTTIDLNDIWMYGGGY
jgi:hypothetical protein